LVGASFEVAEAEIGVQGGERGVVGERLVSVRPAAEANGKALGRRVHQ
jgi:hypothetical protein